MPAYFRHLSFLIALGLVGLMTLTFRPGSESFLGITESTDSIIATEVAGVVSKIHVRSGQKIKKGELLLELSDLNLDMLINQVEYSLKRLKLQRQLANGMVGNPRNSELSPVDIEISQLENDLELKKKKRAALKIAALEDGILGSLQIQEGQYVSAFQALGIFYSTHPRMVRGFLHETAVAEVKIGDNVLVQSASNPTKIANAEVVAVGQRYTTFPDRLKSTLILQVIMGQEVDIKLPDTHEFLPGEKVHISASSNFIKRWTRQAITASRSQ